MESPSFAQFDDNLWDVVDVDPAVPEKKPSRAADASSASTFYDAAALGSALGDGLEADEDVLMPPAFAGFGSPGVVPSISPLDEPEAAFSFGVDTVGMSPVPSVGSPTTSLSTSSSEEHLASPSPPSSSASPASPLDDLPPAASFSFAARPHVATLDDVLDSLQGVVQSRMVGSAPTPPATAAAASGSNSSGSTSASRGRRGGASASPAASTSSSPASTSPASRASKPVKRQASAGRSSDEDDDEEPDAKRRRQLEKNRQSARQCRLKKKAYVENLEADVNMYRNTAEDLRKTNDVLQTENSLLREQVNFLKRLVGNSPATVAQAAEDVSSLASGFEPARFRGSAGSRASSPLASRLLMFAMLSMVVLCIALGGGSSELPVSSANMAGRSLLHVDADGPFVFDRLHSSAARANRRQAASAVAAAGFAASNVWSGTVAQVLLLGSGASIIGMIVGGMLYHRSLDYRLPLARPKVL